MYKIELDKEKDFNDWLEFRKEKDSLARLQNAVNIVKEELRDLRKEVGELEMAKESLTENDVLVIVEPRSMYAGRLTNAYIPISADSISVELKEKLTDILVRNSVIEEPKQSLGEPEPKKWWHIFI